MPEVAERLGVTTKSLYEWVKRYGDRADQFQAAKQRLVDAEQALLDAMDHDTRLLTVSSVQWTDGFRLDLERLGRACVFYGGPDELDSRHGWSDRGNQGDAFFGASVASAGDVNGDGFDDVLIGAYYARGSGNSRPLAGDSYVIFGGASPPLTIDLAGFGAAGIKIFVTRVSTVGEALNAFQAGALLRFNPAAACTGRHGHGAHAP